MSSKAKSRSLAAAPAAAATVSPTAAASNGSSSPSRPRKSRMMLSQDAAGSQATVPRQSLHQPTPSSSGGPMTLSQLGALLFSPTAGRPLTPSRVRDDDLAAVRRTLMARDCVLLTPATKSQLSDDQIRTIIMTAGNASGIANLYLSYLSRFHTHCTSIAQLLDQVSQLRSESQDYKLDLYLYFNKDLSPNAPPQINREEIETLFVAGGGFVALSILQHLSSLSSTFNSFQHLKESLEVQVPDMLAKVSRWKTNLLRFLTCTSVNEFSIEGTAEDFGAAAAAAAASSATGGGSGSLVGASSASSPLLDFKVSIDVVRHLLYIGATDVQLIHLLTRLYNLQKGAKIKDERRLLTMVKKEWQEYLVDIARTMEWMRNAEKNKLFTETSLGAEGKETTIVHVSPAEIDGHTVERVYTSGGLGHLTLSVLKSLNAKRSIKFRSVDALVTALRSQGEAIESMAGIHTYLNSYHCALWPFSHVPRPEITESMISSFLTDCPPGTSIPLVMKECQRFERLGRAFRAKHGIAKDGSSTKGVAAGNHSAAAGTAEDDDTAEDGGSESLPHQFHDWAQLCSTLQQTLPQALAQLQLDRDNLALTLSSVSLLVGGSKQRAYTTHELDTLLTVPYESENAQAEMASHSSGTHNASSAAATAAAAAAARKSFTVADLLALLRRWHGQRKKFASLKALRVGILGVIGMNTFDRTVLAVDAKRAAAAAQQGQGHQKSQHSIAVAAATAAAAALVSEAAAAAAAVEEDDDAPKSPTSNPLLDLHTDVYASLTPQQEKGMLREFMRHPARRLIMPAGASGAPGAAVVGPSGASYVPRDAELDAMLAEKNAMVSGGGATAGAGAGAAAQKSVPLTSIHMFLAALRHMERSLSSPFLSVSELLTALREHYKLLVAQMGETLRYLKTSRRIFVDPTLTITWNQGREMLGLFKEAQADLDTLPLIRKLERERYQFAPYANLQELIAGVRQALQQQDAERAANTRAGAASSSIAGPNDASKSGGVQPHVTDGDRERIRSALIAASQTSKLKKSMLSGSSDSAAGQTVPPDHQPLLPLSFLEDAALASEQINLLLAEFPIFTILQHVHIMALALAPRVGGDNAAAAGAAAGAKSVVPVVSLKPAYPTWHAFSLALHESVLESNRIRAEVFALLSNPSCVLLGLAQPRVPVTYEMVDRLVRACGLLHADLLEVMQHLQDRGVKQRGLPELAARIKSFFLERRRAQAEAARFELIKGELLSYFQSDACHLFLHAQAKVRVCQDLDDDASFVQLMETAGGGTSLKSALQLLHALEADEQAFDSLEGIITGMRLWKSRELLKKRFLPWLNNPSLCTLLKVKSKDGKPGLLKEVKPDDPALNQLLNINISEAAMADLKRTRMPALGAPTTPKAEEAGNSSARSTSSFAGAEEESPTLRVECILEFVQRMNASPTAKRFYSFQELVNAVQRELEGTAPNPDAAPPSLQRPPSMAQDDFAGLMAGSMGLTAASPAASAAASNPQQQAGYESDEEVDVRGLKRGATMMAAAVPPSPHAKEGPAGLSRMGSLAVSRPSPAAASRPGGPAGLSRMGSIAPRTPVMKPASAAAADEKSDDNEGDDLEETVEEREREAARRKQRGAEKQKAEIEALQKHGWILAEDNEWLAIDRRTDIPEPEMTEEILNERRLAIFSALSYPACLLFSNRVEPMSLSDIDLDAVLSSAGGGEKGLKIAASIIALLDRKHAKFMWFDQVTLEIARRWQRRKAWEFLTIDPEGKGMLDHTSSVPLFVLRLLLAINKSHGADPALSAVDMLQLAKQAHPEPFHTHAELIHTIKELVRNERRETLREALSTQFADMFPVPPTLTPQKLDLLLGGVDDSLYHALKYLELIQAEGGRDFADVLDLVALVTSLHSREKSGVPDVFSAELEADDEAAEADYADNASAADPTPIGEDGLMLRRQRIFMSLSFPKCTLFSERTDSFTLTDVDLDDVVKAGNNRLAYALATITRMDRDDKLKFRSFYSAVLELARRCQAHHATQFLLSHENHLLHSSLAMPRDPADPELVALVRQMIDEGMGGADPYLTIVACLRALNQTPRVLAQSPPLGGYRSVDDLVASLRSLANEQRAWMVKSYFTQSGMVIQSIDAATGAVTPAPAISDFQVASFLHVCAQSIYFVLRHLQTIELAATVAAANSANQALRARATFESYEALIDEVAQLHLRTLQEDPALKVRYTPSSAAVPVIDRPNEAKQQQLQQQRIEAAQSGVALDKAARDQIMMGAHPQLDKIKQAISILAQIEHEESSNHDANRIAAATAAAGVGAAGASRKPAEPAGGSVAHRFLVSSRLTLLSALSFPRSQLFAKTARPVVIGDAELDSIFRLAAESVPAAPGTSSSSSGAGSTALGSNAEWIPTPDQVAESLRLVASLDGCGLHFQSFPHFLLELQAFLRGAQRDTLLAALFYPRCKLFTAASRHIEVDEREMDQMLDLSVAGQRVPLHRVLHTLDLLEATDTKVFSFVELIELVQKKLAATNGQ